jgi:hypothetical protein
MTTFPAGIALVLACMAAAFAGVLTAALAGRILAPRLGCWLASHGLDGPALAQRIYQEWRGK